MSTRLALMTVALLALWILAGPIGMAFDGCATMGAMCEGPCGAAACTLVLVAPIIGLAQVAALPRLGSTPPASTVLGVPTPPPRLTIRPA